MRPVPTTFAFFVGALGNTISSMLAGLVMRLLPGFIGMQ